MIAADRLGGGRGLVGEDHALCRRNRPFASRSRWRFNRVALLHTLLHSGRAGHHWCRSASNPRKRPRAKRDGWSKQNASKRSVTDRSVRQNGSTCISHVESIHWGIHASFLFASCCVLSESVLLRVTFQKGGRPDLRAHLSSSAWENPAIAAKLSKDAQASARKDRAMHYRRSEVGGERSSELVNRAEDSR